MLNFYDYIVTTVMDNSVICQKKITRLVDDTEISEKVTEIVTWENVDNFCETMQNFIPFYEKVTKKGKILYFDEHDTFFFCKNPKKIKEWKSEICNLTVTTEMILKKVSISDVLNWRDAEKSMEFILQRGGTIGKEWF